MKKLFDWTPRDVLAWEKIRKQGFWHFVLCQHNESLKGRYDLLVGMDIVLLDDNERNRLRLPKYPD